MCDFENEEEYESSPEEIVALADIERMRVQLCGDDKLSMLFFVTFGQLPEEASFVSTLLCEGGYLMYQKDSYICYFIRVINEGKSLEILVT